MRTLPSVSQQWLCEVLWGVTAPGRASRQGRQHSLWAQLSCPCRPVRKAEEKSRTSVCPGFLPAPAKGRGSTDAAGGGHLL